MLSRRCRVFGVTDIKCSCWPVRLGGCVRVTLWVGGWVGYIVCLCPRLVSSREDKFFFPKLVEYMTSGPVVIMELEGVNAVKVWGQVEGANRSEEGEQGLIPSVKA